MLNYILTSGDRAMFNPIFGKATVIVPAAGVVLTGTGIPKVNNKEICIVGDEKRVIVPPCSYTSPPHITPGIGTLSIESLAANQIAIKVKSKRIAVLLKGTTFIAKFQVTTPAQTPTPPQPDLILQYFGTGYFTTTNMKVKGR
ncbi:hypothetical protein H6G96_26045 [Nostoc sp. FACHB-892]|uniref:hypothetical protein n=1 Tax=Nostoc sp. FACHB-892 TaxID=2692843 RepID=UPI00168907FE|nr:hypothetical protein [Nostoc sp. FACHB-892]MBD2729683.1 hypothetical protein [Nostoc sp. FACHB-892]